VRLCRWILLFSIFLPVSGVSSAQTDNWAVLSPLLAHQKVKVVTYDGKSRVGAIQSVTGDTVQLEHDPVIEKVDVQQVLLWSPGHHGRNAMIGLASGIGVGLGFGAACGGKDAFVSKGQCMAVGAPFFGGLGAGIGVLLPSRGQWQAVYRAPEKKQTTTSP
jgi:hypothetical protein